MAARSHLDEGYPVLVVVCYGRRRKAILERALESAPVHHVLLLPPWQENEMRTRERIEAAEPGAMPHIGWAAHQTFLRDLQAMVTDGEFDDVFDAYSLGVEESAFRVLRHLGLEFEGGGPSSTRPGRASPG